MIKMKTINIGLFGAGTVGGGVIEILDRSALSLQKQGLDIRVKKIGVRDLNKTRNFAMPQGSVLVTDPEEVLEDPAIDCIVELIGGAGMAWDVVRRAFERQKHIVTANKTVIAQHLGAIQELQHENPRVCFGFEASVGGGDTDYSNTERSFCGR
jgi:homoserine dehydrogenase